MEALLLKLVQSLRASNFQMFVNALDEMAPWMFALDHTHYARWLPIFMQDLKMLEIKHPDVFCEFQKGRFTYKKTDRPFFCMAEDQAHEQNNKDVKTDGGAVGILDTESSLMKWMIGGPEIACLVKNFNNEQHGAMNKHHEDTDAHENKFHKDVKNFKECVAELGNPFSEDDNSLVQIMSRTVMNAKKIGEDQYEEYVQERLVKCEKSIHLTIPNNNLPLFRKKSTVSTSNAKLKVASLKDDYKLYASLYITCQSRSGDKGKKTCWNAWKSFPEITETFSRY